MIRLLMSCAVVVSLHVAAAGQVLWFRLPTPILLGGSGADEWDGLHASHPAVLYRHGTYHMWYAGEGPSGCAIGYARSRDGVLWESFPANPVLRDGQGGAWDTEFVGHPTVVYDGAQYHMWYAGYGGTALRIGHAVSGDGVTWQKHAAAVLAPGGSGDWDGEGVSSPTVLRLGDGYDMWYAGFDGVRMRIGHARSADGLVWEKDAGNPVVDAGAAGAWDAQGVSDPAVVFDGRKFRMWHSGFDGTHRRIGYATSADGVTWQQSGSGPVLEEGGTDTWNSVGVTGPAVVQRGSSYHLWYTGYDDAHMRLGYATSQIPGDIDGDGTISAMDAVLVLQYVIRLIDDFPVQLLSTPKEVQSLSSYEVALGDVHAAPGQRVSVPLSVADGRGLYAGGVRVRYDPAVLRAVDAIPQGLLNGSYWKTSTELPGEVSCAFVCTDPLAGGGDLFALRFEVLGAGEMHSTPLTIEDATFNDGVDVVCADGAVSALPRMARLLPGYPNPFNPHTTVRYSIPVAGHARLTVHNAAGQVVRRLLDAGLDAGEYRTTWDGRDDGGNPVTSGVYLCRLLTYGSSASQKLVLVR